MSAIDGVFEKLRAERRAAFVPFITAGDPDLEFTAETLRLLDEHGASICEVGIPYSDPIADGPVIQTSYTRALAAGVRLESILATLRGVSPQMTAPCVTMVSYAIVHRVGRERFVESAREAGVAGAIVPDLPVEEADALAGVCRAADISLIQLITPTTPRDRALRIAAASTGFVYYVSVTGITGERTELPPELVDNVGWLREQAGLPVCVGFGISTPEHVRQVAAMADGVIVGSAIVRRMAAASQQPRQQVLDDLARYVDELVAPLAKH